MAGVMIFSCKKEENPNNPDKPGGGENSVTDTLSGVIYTETMADLNFSMEMVGVQGGTFSMGATSDQGNAYEPDEKPVQNVTLPSYYISRYEITQAQWKAIMGTTIQEQKDKAQAYYEEDILELFGVGDNYPMYYVNWFEAKEFCVKLSEKTGKKYVLPSEAQWEFAARGGNKSKHYKYSGGNDLKAVAWYTDNSNKKTHPVGTKTPNELGLYDMTGNVYEWCEDWYGLYGRENEEPDPDDPMRDLRVDRGGCWYESDYECRISYRDNFIPEYAHEGLGFRVVRVVE